MLWFVRGNDYSDTVGSLGLTNVFGEQFDNINALAILLLGVHSVDILRCYPHTVMFIAALLE